MWNAFEGNDSEKEEGKEEGQEPGWNENPWGAFGDGNDQEEQNEDEEGFDDFQGGWAETNWAQANQDDLEEEQKVVEEEKQNHQEVDHEQVVHEQEINIEPSPQLEVENSPDLEKKEEREDDQKGAQFQLNNPPEAQESQNQDWAGENWGEFNEENEEQLPQEQSRSDQHYQLEEASAEKEIQKSDPQLSDSENKVDSQAVGEVTSKEEDKREGNEEMLKEDEFCVVHDHKEEEEKQTSEVEENHQFTLLDKTSSLQQSNEKEENKDEEEKETQDCLQEQQEEKSNKENLEQDPDKSSEEAKQLEDQKSVEVEESRDNQQSQNSEEKMEEQVQIIEPNVDGNQNDQNDSISQEIIVQDIIPQTQEIEQQEEGDGLKKEELSITQENGFQDQPCNQEEQVSPDQKWGDWDNIQESAPEENNDRMVQEGQQEEQEGEKQVEVVDSQISPTIEEEEKQQEEEIKEKEIVQNLSEEQNQEQFAQNREDELQEDKQDGFGYFNNNEDPQIKEDGGWAFGQAQPNSDEEKPGESQSEEKQVEDKEGWGWGATNDNGYFGNFQEEEQNEEEEGNNWAWGGFQEETKEEPLNDQFEDEDEGFATLREANQEETFESPQKADSQEGMDQEKQNFNEGLEASPDLNEEEEEFNDLEEAQPNLQQEEEDDGFDSMEEATPEAQQEFIKEKAPAQEEDFEDFQEETIQQQEPIHSQTPTQLRAKDPSKINTIFDIYPDSETLKTYIEKDLFKIPERRPIQNLAFNKFQQEWHNKAKIQKSILTLPEFCCHKEKSLAILDPLLQQAEYTNFSIQTDYDLSVTDPTTQRYTLQKKNKQTELLMQLDFGTEYKDNLPEQEKTIREALNHSNSWEKSALRTVLVKQYNIKFSKPQKGRDDGMNRAHTQIVRKESQNFSPMEKNEALKTKKQTSIEKDFAQFEDNIEVFERDEYQDVIDGNQQVNTSFSDGEDPIKQQTQEVLPAQRPNDNYVKETFAKFGLNMNLLEGGSASEDQKESLRNKKVNSRVKRVLDAIPNYNSYLFSH